MLFLVQIVARVRYDSDRPVWWGKGDVLPEFCKARVILTPKSTDQDQPPDMIAGSERCVWICWSLEVMVRTKGLRRDKGGRSGGGRE